MSQTIPDFWPTDFGVGTVRTPAAILREQAARLGEKTRHLVVAKVEQSPRGNTFGFSFNLMAPALGSYRYVLFSIEYGIEPYPLTVYGLQPSGFKVSSEEEFIELLRKTLSSEETKRVIATLLAHSQQ